MTKNLFTMRANLLQPFVVMVDSMTLQECVSVRVLVRMCIIQCEHASKLLGKYTNVIWLLETCNLELAQVKTCQTSTSNILYL